MLPWVSPWDPSFSSRPSRDVYRPYIIEELLSAYPSYRYFFLLFSQCSKYNIYWTRTNFFIKYMVKYMYSYALCTKIVFLCKIGLRTRMIYFFLPWTKSVHSEPWLQHIIGQWRFTPPSPKLIPIYATIIGYKYTNLKALVHNISVDTKNISWVHNHIVLY